MSGAAKSRAGAGVKVRIAERCVFYVGDCAYVAGQVVELAKAEAEALLASGQAESAGRPPRNAKASEEPAGAKPAAKRPHARRAKPAPAG